MSTPEIPADSQDIPVQERPQSRFEGLDLNKVQAQELYGAVSRWLVGVPTTGAEELSEETQQAFHKVTTGDDGTPLSREEVASSYADHITAITDQARQSIQSLRDSTSEKK